jgi:mannose-6-phosphate isomerase-like protein (cupin superfamily)
MSFEKRYGLGKNTMKKIEKPWGHEEIWALTDKYVGKILHILSGHKLSLQYHIKKEETFRILNGTMDLQIGSGMNEQILRMNSGDIFHCPPGTIHRMIALTDVDILEVSTTELDDVVRLEDSYGRANPPVNNI